FDRVGADVLAGVTSERGRNAIAALQRAAGDLVRQSRIAIAIDLALRIRCDRDGAFVDRQVSFNEIEVVIVTAVGVADRYRSMLRPADVDVLACVTSERARNA